MNPRPFGSWKSPITSDLIVSESIGLGLVKLDGDDLYWLEMRPSEGGRQVIVRLDRSGNRVDLTPAGDTKGSLVNAGDAKAAEASTETKLGGRQQ